MSWQRAGPEPRPPGPPPPAQAYDNQQQQGLYGGYQGVPPSSQPSSQQYWQAPPYEPSPQYCQYPPPDYTNNANAAPAPPQCNHNYNSSAAYPSQQPAASQQGYYPGQGQVAYPAPPPSEQWGDNWDWGWDDGTRQAGQQPPPAQTQPQTVYNNANVIEESFTSKDTWNWSEDNRDKKDNTETPNANQVASLNTPVENNLVHEPSRNSSNHSAHVSEEVKSLGDRDVIKESLPNLALGKRFHLDNLTPQWSIESQMSQESSDGPHTQSEGTYRSDNQSRNSSSPGPNIDQGNFNYSQSVAEEYPTGDWERGDGCELTDGLQELSIASREAPEPATARSKPGAGSGAREETAPPPAPSPPPVAQPPAPPAAPPQAQALLPPPSGFVAPPAPGNPFKQGSPFSHRKQAAANFPPPGFGANLETAPDNAERPEGAAPAPRPAPPAPEPDNLEVAPRQERDHYLQTAHLTPDYGENTDFREAPPAGLRRLVQGGAGDEPPPGLARLVPGRGAEPYRPVGGRERLERGRLPPGDGRASAGSPPAAPREPPADGENLQDPLAAPAPEPAPAPPPRRADTEDEERARGYGSSPRLSRDADEHRPPRDRDSDGRYSRGDRTYDRDRDERRSTRDDRRSTRDERSRRDTKERRRRDERTGSPARRRDRRYDTEDTDYCSDRERQHRRYREGSHTSRPPRPDDRDRDRDRRRGEAGDRDRDRDRDHRRYRDIDPARPRGGTRANTHDDRTRVVTFKRVARRSAELGREWGGGSDRRRRGRSDRDRERDRERDRDYYGTYPGAGGAGYALTPQQYAYYETLRRTDPAAYLRVYNQLMAQTMHPSAYGAAAAAAAALGGGGSARGSERGSGHSGRSSAALRLDTYYGAPGAGDSLRGATYSHRTDLSDRDLTTDMSLNLQAEESMRSDRMTPLLYSTPHVKGRVSCSQLAVARGGQVRLLSLAAIAQGDPRHCLLASYPGPLIKGVTHKKSVIEYCELMGRQARAGRGGERDGAGRGLLWALLRLMLRQNGVVVGADIAELLMDPRGGERQESRRGSWESQSEGEEPQPRAPPEPLPSGPETAASIGTMREYLTYGNRTQALEWAMSQGLWGHALQLSVFADRRSRALVAARFLASLAPNDPLHTLYSHLQAKQPPAATCCADERWGDWRAHAAIIIANSSGKPEQDTKTLIQLGDSLQSRGLRYSAQVVYLSGGVAPSRHPLAPLQRGPPPPAPPRLALLLADPKATTLAELATDEAIIATEIYEYAMSLHQDYNIPDFQVYKLIMACRLLDLGLWSRALGYLESCAVALHAAPGLHSSGLARAVGRLAERCRAMEPDDAEPGSAAPSPEHHRWIDHMHSLADHMQSAWSEPTSPQHQVTQYHQPVPSEPQWVTSEQLVQSSQPPEAQPESVGQSYADPAPDYSHLYHPQPQSQPADSHPEPAPEPELAAQYGGEWGRSDDTQQYQGDYWQGYNYGETGGSRAMITMPGARSQPAEHDDGTHDDDQTEGELDSGAAPAPAPATKGAVGGGAGGGGAGWLGGILTKLSLRAPNQMILPDDKNPSIVWDPERKRWRNLDEGEEDGPSAAPPPPPASLPANIKPLSTSSPLGGPPPPASNMLRMQKSRHIKKSYVDVFNGGPAPNATGGAAPPPAPPAAPPSYFVPAPPNQSGIYEPLAEGNNYQ